MFELGPKIERGYGKGRDLDELTHRIHSVVNLREQFVVGAFNIKQPDRISIRNNGPAVIALWGSCCEVRAVDLGDTRLAPARLTRAMCAARLWLAEVVVARLSPQRHSLNVIARAVDHVQAAGCAWQQPGETRSGGR